MEHVFKCKTITPMFLAGADGNTPEIRPASIKGVLRFWWRALNGHLSSEKLYHQESTIFGGTGQYKDEDGKEKEYGKSRVRIRVKSGKITGSDKNLPMHKTTSTHKGRTVHLNILDYLCFGPCAYEKGKGMVFNRPYIPTDLKFDILISFDERKYPDVMTAISLMFEYGALGAKSRNGFGSINAEGKTLKNYTINKSTLFDGIPKYPALSKNIRLYKTSEQNSWDSALAELGIAYKNAREAIDERHYYENRQYIAAPIITPEGQQSHLARHSKPYFMHISESNGKYIGQILYLPSEYAPGIQGLNQHNENQNFLNACNLLNQQLSKSLQEVQL